MIRLFIALKIPDFVKTEIKHVCGELSGNDPDIMWESSEKIHLTLKFIGEVNDELLKPVSDSLGFIKNFSKINCSVVKFDFLIRFKEPKILWAELKTDESVYSLAEEINQKLFEYGIEKETKKFKPHLTLLRIKKNPGEEFIKRFKNYSLSEIKFKAAEVALIESKLSQSGSVYKEINKYDLR